MNSQVCNPIQFAVEGREAYVAAVLAAHYNLYFDYNHVVLDRHNYECDYPSFKDIFTKEEAIAFVEFFNLMNI